MTLREPYIPYKETGKTASELIYLWGRIAEEYANRNPPNQDGLYKYIEDVPFLASQMTRLVKKIDKMEKTLEGYASGKWAKEALE